MDSHASMSAFEGALGLTEKRGNIAVLPTNQVFAGCIFDYRQQRILPTFAALIHGLIYLPPRVGIC